MRYPLYLKILLWFFLNLAVLGVAAYAFIGAQLHLGLESLLSGRTGDRIAAVSEVISYELVETPRTSWGEVLDRFSDAYGVEFFVFREDGEWIGGRSMEFPGELLEVIKLKGNPLGIPPRIRRRGNLGGAGAAAEAEGGIEAGAGVIPEGAPVRRPDPLFLIRSEDPTAYWVGVRSTIRNRDLPPPHTGILVVRSESLLNGGLFLDPKPWLFVGFGVVVFCLLFWFPLVRGITRSIREMTEATERIAEGKFDAHINDRRSDELGRLGGAVNRMARRLEGFVTGQKRFLGDIAHELCSPLARMQMALGVLEQKTAEKDHAYLEDVREEVEQMSEMVAELLSFSKASLEAKKVNLEPVTLREIVDRVVERERSDGVAIETEVDVATKVLADERLLSRSLGNLVRNAVIYAGGAGPITVSARRNGESVDVVVTDCGPGIPDDALQKIFDPFFRPEEARTRDTGGVGLGLAIVKTCVEACRGTVTCRNREPSGLEVRMRLAVG